MPGETHFFAVDADYGQQVSFAGQLVDEANDFDTPQRSLLTIDAFNSARAPLTLSGANTPLFKDREFDTSYSAPINFANRYGGDDGEGSDNNDVASYWLDGTQYFAVSYDRVLASTSTDTTEELPALTYTLVADVSGDPTSGPEFAPLPDSDSPEDTDTNGQASNTAAPDSDDTAEAAGDEEESGISPTALIFGSAILAILIIALLFGTRRKKN